MIQSRKIENVSNLKGPEAALKLFGSGCCMLEVETNGGFKVIGILGRFRMEVSSAGVSQDLMPGELVFVMPGDRGFGEKVNVNVGKIIETSYLISGFSNASSFRQSLATISAAQENSIGKTFAAEVGDAKSPDRFEVLPTAVPKPGLLKSTRSPFRIVRSPEVDPLLSCWSLPKKNDEIPTFGLPNISPNSQLNLPSRMILQIIQTKPRPFRVVCFV